MYKKILGYYWKWRIYQNQRLMKDLQALKVECRSYPDLLKDVEKQIDELSYLIYQAEIQSAKLSSWNSWWVSSNAVDHNE